MAPPKSELKRQHQRHFRWVGPAASRPRANIIIQQRTLGQCRWSRRADDSCHLRGKYRRTRWLASHLVNALLQNAGRTDSMGCGERGDRRSIFL